MMAIFRMSWRFQTRALAVAWAEGERRMLEAGRYDDAPQTTSSSEVNRVYV